MSLKGSDLGEIGSLATAIGLLDSAGDPNPLWFGAPDDFLGQMLADETQREALIDFIDEVLGEAERERDAAGLTWLPLLSFADPQLELYLTIDDAASDSVAIGVGVVLRTTTPATRTRVSIPLFSAAKTGGAVPGVFHLGQRGARLRASTSITVDETLPVPGEAHLGSIGVEVDLPTGPDDSAPVLSVTLGSLQLPGANESRDLRLSGDDIENLDDVVLELILSMVREQAAGDNSGALGGVAGLLGLVGDSVPAFPIEQLADEGVVALGAWLYQVMGADQSREAWVDHLAGLLGGARVGDEVQITVGSAELVLGISVGTGTTGNQVLTPTLGVVVGDSTARVEARCKLFRIDLVEQAATALPSFGIWAAAGHASAPALDISSPDVRADTVRVGFEVNADRQLVFVLAADAVTIGDQQYSTLDLTSPDAVMDGVGAALDDVLDGLLANLGTALTPARLLLGLDPPPGTTTVPTVSLTALMGDPVAAVAGYWQTLIVDHRDAVPAALEVLGNELGAAASAGLPVSGTGVPADPWRVPLVASLELQVFTDAERLVLAAAVSTSNDTLGERCTVLESSLSAIIADINLTTLDVDLFPGVSIQLKARERGARPTQARLELLDGTVIRADHVGIGFVWKSSVGLGCEISAPNLALEVEDEVILLPDLIGASGDILQFDNAAWDAIERLIGHLSTLLSGFVGDAVELLGWRPSGESQIPGLRLRDLVADPGSALAGWIPQLAVSDLAPNAISLLADLVSGNGSTSGALGGSGHPDDPYRIVLGSGLPEPAVWFPPSGPDAAISAASEALQRWRPGDRPLSPSALAAELFSEAAVDSELSSLVTARPIDEGLGALLSLWSGSDGRITEPLTPPPGIEVHSESAAAGQLLGRLDLESELGRIPDTVVWIDIGPTTWATADSSRRVDLSAPGLAPEMFTPPTAAPGEWFVSLGRRAACRLSSGDADGTVGQAARLKLVLDAFATVDSALVVVALGGAGHAARVAAQQTTGVSDLVLVGTPLAPVALSALGTQPAGDAVRLLARLLPEVSATDEDEDLALGRYLVADLMDLVELPDPAAELRLASETPPGPRPGLRVLAVFGAVGRVAVARSITAIVASGLSLRARNRAAASEPAEVTSAVAGLVFRIPERTAGSLDVTGDARLGLVGVATDGSSVAPELRVRVSIGDRLGWLAATPEHELRRISIDARFPVSPGQTGSATITLHDARVLSTTWERLVVGGDAEHLPLLPEARILLDLAVSRLVEDAATAAGSAAALALAEVLGLIDGGGAVNDAFDQLVRDPVGLVSAAVGRSEVALQVAVQSLLGDVGSHVDLVGREIRLQAGSDLAGLFGWNADVVVGLDLLPTAASSALQGGITFGRQAVGPAGGLQLSVGFEPLAVQLLWHRSDATTTTVELWPEPQGSLLASAIGDLAPALGAHAALEVMRRADEGARSTIDTALDALGLLGEAGDGLYRPLRPLVGLLTDPGRWLRTAAALAGQPAKAQALADAVRPLLGLGGVSGDALTFANGVSLSIAGDGGAIALTTVIGSAEFDASPSGPGITGGLSTTLSIGPSGPPSVSAGLRIGVANASTGRSAVHLTLSDSGSVAVFLRPAAGLDLPLVPFAGLGSLTAVATAALPFLLDSLAALPGEVGPLVRTVGDALGLRSGTPAAFDAAALSAWASDPVSALNTAVPGIVDVGLDSLALVLDPYTSAAVAVTATGTELTVAVGRVAAVWAPSSGSLSVTGVDIAVPGVERFSFITKLSSLGLDQLLVSVGPAEIAIGGTTIKPFLAVSAGAAPAGGAGLAIGLDAGSGRRFAARWMFASGDFDLVAGAGPLDGLDLTIDPAEFAIRAVEVVIDLVATVALATTAVQELLDFEVGTQKLSDVLVEVVLAADAVSLLDGLFDPDTLVARALRLLENLAVSGVSLAVDELEISLVRQGDGTIGVQVGLTDRFELVSGEVMVWLETDASWIDPGPVGAGVFVGLVSAGSELTFVPSLTVAGVGIRIGKLSGPLVDVGLTLESVALHVFADMTGAGVRAGGVQIEFTNLAVAASGASGGNAIASGIMSDTGSQPPQPGFSPALAIQKHGGDSAAVTLRAGAGDGPWWIGVQRGFGPLYLEQVGVGVSMPNRRVERVSILFDGSVSMFGLVCVVDDLEITYLVSRNDFFNPASWEVDLAGLAVSADMAGMTIAGGLLKSVDADSNIEYLGMLLARFGVYGITIYGGYGQAQENGNTFVSFFAVGAIVGPIGGPPAFFLTGIGGGFGINRELIVPTELSQFGDYPLIKALDTAASPGNPMEELRALGEYFPSASDTYWFAAGLSFTSFVIVEGIAVVAVEFGDGLDISLLGLARLVLPRPEVALVSIELALLVRFSSSEGVLWIQAQLTDNSWLLYKDVRLTGGFAFVIWFKGDKRGQFVLTMGGYHPDFYRAGYPEVPRLGVEWKVANNIVISASGYFALTSEALMVGGDFEASATFGPAWAEVSFGAHGIVYFDPFHYKVNAYARIGAGVTVDLWILGEVTFSISIGASIEVEGPDFHGVARFEVGPVELKVEFGSSERFIDPPLSADTFIDKYLARASDGRAQVITVVTSFGAGLPVSGAPTPDGNPDRPYLVTPEFGLVVTTIVPSSGLLLKSPSGDISKAYPASRTIGVAPMDIGSLQPEIQFSWIRSGANQNLPFLVGDRPYGAFPVGVWGPPQDDNNREMPKGDVIQALTDTELSAQATVGFGGPEIPYYQVEIGQRLPLPFSRQPAATEEVRQAGRDLTDLVTLPRSVDEAFAQAELILSNTASPTALAALRRERQAPPLVSSLGEGLDSDPISVTPALAVLAAVEPVDSSVRAPYVVGMLPASGALSLGDPSRVGARQRTNVSDIARPFRVEPPTLAAVDAARSRSIATGLIFVEPPATPTLRTRRSGTVVATGDLPPSQSGRAKPAVVTARGGDGNKTLRDFASALKAGRRTSRGNRGAVLGPGDVVVLRLPNARHDVHRDALRPQIGLSGPPVRIVAIADGGAVLADLVISTAFEVPQFTDRIVLIGQGTEEASQPLSRAGLTGWHASMELPYIGWSTAIGPGCTAKTRGESIPRHRERSGAGWLRGAELSHGSTTVTTRFAEAIQTVVVVLDDSSSFLAGGAEGELLLGLAGAQRALDERGEVLRPIVLTAESRNVVAYAIEASGDESVVVTLVSEPELAVVGVLGSASLDPRGAISVVAARGLDAAMSPLATGRSGLTRVRWIEPKEEQA